MENMFELLCEKIDIVRDKPDYIIIYSEDYYRLNLSAKGRYDLILEGAIKKIKGITIVVTDNIDFKDKPEMVSKTPLYSLV